MAAILAHTATAGDFCFGRMFLCLFVRLRENFQNIGRLWLKGSRLLLTLDQNSQIIIPNFLLGGVFRHAGFHSSPQVDSLISPNLHFTLVIEYYSVPKTNHRQMQLSPAPSHSVSFVW